MSDLLSRPHGFHSAAIQASSHVSLSLPSGSACIIDNKAKTLDDTEVHN